LELIWSANQAKTEDSALQGAIQHSPKEGTVWLTYFTPTFVKL